MEEHQKPIEEITVKLADLTIQMKRSVLEKMPYFESYLNRWSENKLNEIDASAISFDLFTRGLSELDENLPLTYLGFPEPLPPPPIVIPERIPEISYKISPFTVCESVSMKFALCAENKYMTTFAVKSLSYTVLYLPEDISFCEFRLICNGNVNWVVDKDINDLILDIEEIKTISDKRFTRIYIPPCIEDSTDNSGYMEKRVEITVSAITAIELSKCRFMYKERNIPRDRHTADGFFNHVKTENVSKSYVLDGDINKISYGYFTQYHGYDIKNTEEFHYNNLCKGIVIISEDEIENITLIDQGGFRITVDGFTASTYMWLLDDKKIPSKKTYFIQLERLNLASGRMTINLDSGSGSKRLYTLRNNMILCSDGSCVVRYSS